MEQNQAFILVPQSWLKRIEERQEKILAILQSKNNNFSSIGDYITETDTKRLLGRKSTWFWSMRKNGKLKYTKVGRTTYYSKQDIIELLDKNHSEQ